MIRSMTIVIVVALGVVGCAGMHPVSPSQEPVKRTLLQKVEYPPGFVTQTMLVEVMPGATVNRHTHPGIETSYILEGDVELAIDGKPIVMLKAGDSFTIPAGVAHGGKVGPRGARLVGTFVVDSSKPLASPVP